MAEKAHQDEQERDDKEDDGAQALRLNCQLGDDPVDGHDNSCDTLSCHHCLGVLAREHARETVVAGLLDCVNVCVCEVGVSVCVCVCTCM